MFEMALPVSLKKSVDATKVEYVQLGSSGLRISVPVFGAMSLGSKEWVPWVLDEEESLELLKAAFDRGVNTWDTANAYSNGISEEFLGKAIRKFNIPREKLVIMTKAYLYVAEEPGIHALMFPEQMSQSKDYVNQGGECNPSQKRPLGPSTKILIDTAGLSRSAIFKAVDASLARLGTTYIDLFQIHRYDPTTPPEETVS